MDFNNIQKYIFKINKEINLHDPPDSKILSNKIEKYFIKNKICYVKNNFFDKKTRDISDINFNYFIFLKDFIDLFFREIFVINKFTDAYDSTENFLSMLDCHKIKKSGIFFIQILSIYSEK